MTQKQESLVSNPKTSQYSLNGVPVCTGAGLEATKQRIQQAFAQARQRPVDTPPILRTHQRVEPSTAATIATPTPPRLPLSTLAAPILKVAARNIKRPLSTSQRHNTYVFKVPTESAETLITQANRVISELPDADDRFDVGEIQKADS